MTSSGAVVAALAVLTTSWLPSVARAHDRSRSHVELRVDGPEVRVRFRMAALDANALRAEGIRLESHPPRALVLSEGSAPCAVVPGSVRVLAPEPAYRRWEWRVDCSMPTHIAMRELVPSPHHVAFVVARKRTAIHRVALTSRVPTARLRFPSDAPPLLALPVMRVSSLFVVGVEHILGGLDHLLFLAMLLLLARRLRDVVVVVTGFTLGHAATIVLAATGAVQAESRIVEAAIALSIALVALENVWLVDDRRNARLPVAAVCIAAVCAIIAWSVALAGVAIFAACWLAWEARSERPERSRLAVAALFGLVHGLGFASALGADAGGIPELVGFNMGVELGQLLVVALAWPLLLWGRRVVEERRIVVAGSAVACAAASFWLFGRL